MKKIIILIVIVMLAKPSFAQKSNLDLLIGTKQFGSHWISPYGKVFITKVKDSVYIDGSQVNGLDYCNIKGTIKVIDDRNFEFNGTIALRFLFDRNNLLTENKDDKVLTGKFLFRRIKDRKYWRLKQPETETGTGYFKNAYHYIDVFMN